jgi:hypothetical protein
LDSIDSRYFFRGIVKKWREVIYIDDFSLFLLLSVVLQSLRAHPINRGDNILIVSQRYVVKAVKGGYGDVHNVLYPEDMIRMNLWYDNN